MSRFNPLRYTKPTPPTYSVEGMNALFVEINTGFEELGLLSKLESNLHAINDRGNVTVVEAMLAAGSLNRLTAKQTGVSLAIESVHLGYGLNTKTVSLENVSEMTSKAIDWIIEKIKKFFKWIDGLVEKFVKGSKVKSARYRKAKTETSDAKETVKDAMSDPEFKKQASDFKNRDDTTVLKYRKLFNILKSKEANISSGDVTFTLKSTKALPFKKSEDFRQFVEFINRKVGSNTESLYRATRDFTYDKASDSKEKLKKIITNITEASEFSKFYEEVDVDSVASFQVKRVSDKDAMIVQVSEFSDIFENCISLLTRSEDLLRDAKDAKDLSGTALSLLKNAEGTEDQKTSVRQVINAWLRFSTMIVNMVTNSVTITTRVGDECTEIIDALK